MGRGWCGRSEALGLGLAYKTSWDILSWRGHETQGGGVWETQLEVSRLEIMIRKS